MSDADDWERHPISSRSDSGLLGSVNDSASLRSKRPPGPVHFFAEVKAVIAPEYNERVVLYPALLETAQQSAHAIIDVGDTDEAGLAQRFLKVSIDYL